MKKTNSRTRWSDKKKPVKKSHVTKKEYRQTTAESVDKSLDAMFRFDEKSHTYSLGNKTLYGVVGFRKTR